MHPAFSVLFFTVTSGFGYGFLFCLLLAKLTGTLPLTDSEFGIAALVAAVLFTLGLLSSTQHLANPRNAWRSFVRVRTSWLSREAVLAVLGYPLFAATVFSVLQQWPLPVTQSLLILSLLWIVLLVVSTAMIYASLKTIPQWHNVWVPLCFVMFALISGLLCLGYAVDWRVALLRPVTLASLLLGIAMKAMYFRHIGRPTRSSINTATSFSQAQVTLFDSGHSSPNFLQREFIYEVGPRTTKLARIMTIVLVFLIPGILIASSNAAAAGLAALASAYTGLLLERWLFFVEAKHVVRHYYGE